MISQGRIADELASDGHDVVNFEPDFSNIAEKFVPCKKCKRLIMTGMKNGMYLELQREYSEKIMQSGSIWKKLFDFGTDPHMDEYNNLCEEIISNKTIIRILKTEKFDAYFGEHVHLCGMGLAHVLGIKHRFWVASNSMGVTMRSGLGLATPPSFLPYMAHLDNQNPAPFLQRARNLLLHVLHLRNEYRDMMKTTNMYRKHFGNDFPTVEELAVTSDAVFVTTDELLELPAPTLSNILHIGGLGIANANVTLDEEFSIMMEKGDGVIFFSLGTVANTTKLPPKMMENMLKNTQRFQNYQFIVKVDKFDKNSFTVAKSLKNVMMVDWAPQPAILAHPRLKLFITHAGFNSLMESAWNGVPVITIPFMFDQPRNGRTVEKKGWGILKDRKELLEDPESIEKAIRTVLEVPSYREKAIRLKNLIRTRPQTASEKLLRTTSWILNNGGISELQYEGKHIMNMFPDRHKSLHKANDKEKEKKRINEETRIAIQKVTQQRIANEEAAENKRKDDAVIRQFGFGESSSDDDCGGARVMIPIADRVDPDSVFMLPEKRKQKEAKEMRRATNRDKSWESSSSRRRDSRRDSQRDRSGSRERSRRDDRDRDRNAKKKKRRRHSSSEPESDSRSRSRERRRNDRNRDPTAKKKKSRRHSSSESESDSRSRSREKRREIRESSSTGKRPKYTFLTDAEYAKCQNYLQANILFADRQSDEHNWSSGMRKNEVANCHLGVRFIDGLENHQKFFESVYGLDVKPEKPMNFHEMLGQIHQHVPKEKFFRGRPLENGYWRISRKPDISNFAQNDMEERSGLDDFTFQKRAELRETFENNKYDINAVIEWLELEDEIHRSGNRRDWKAHNERKLSIVEAAVHYNPMNALVHLIEIELLKEMTVSPARICKKYSDLVHKLPHEPMAWLRYLDYVQHTEQVYNEEEMLELFRSCLSTLQGHIDGTFVSHLRSVNDMPMLQLAHFFVYVKLLKWQIACGNVHLALANIQATFELNFGSPHTKTHMKKKQNLSDLWEAQVPRIGDDGGIGAEKQLMHVRELAHSDAIAQESVAYDIFLYEIGKAKDDAFRSASHIGQGWVNLERKMKDLDTRVKRTNWEENSDFQTVVNQSNVFGLTLTPIVLKSDLITYYRPDDCTLVVQPLLELLGISFHSSTGWYSLTENVIEEWRETFLVLNDEKIFDQVPTYSEKTMQEVGERILNFMLYYQHELVKGDEKSLDKKFVKYIIALLMTKAKKMEEEMQHANLKINHLNKLIEGGLMQKHSELLKYYPNLLITVRLVAADIFLSWWEKDLVQTAEAEQKSTAAAEGNIVRDKGRNKKLMQMARKVFKRVDKCVPRVVNETTSYLRNESSASSTLQLHLYTNILRARATFQHESNLRCLLAMEILEKSQEQIEDIKGRDDFADVVKRGMQEIVTLMKVRDSESIHNFIPELPRPGVLAVALQIIVDIVFLNMTPNKQTIVGEAVERVLKASNYFQQQRMDFSLRADDKEQDELDIQFLLDTIIGQLTTRSLIVIYYDCYKEIIRRATELFPFKTKYMKLFTELNSGSIFKSIKLDTFLDVKNKQLMKKQLDIFDPTIERQLLQNSLSSMMSTLKSAEDRNNGKQMVFTKYMEEALKLRDPAVWRLVLKAAARIGKTDLLKNAYRRMHGDCKWSFNAHIDFVEGMGPADPSIKEVRDGPVGQAMLNLLMLGSPIAVHDIQLQTLWDIANNSVDRQTIQ